MQPKQPKTPQQAQKIFDAISDLDIDDLDDEVVTVTNVNKPIAITGNVTLSQLLKIARGVADEEEE